MFLTPSFWTSKILLSLCSISHREESCTPVGTSAKYRSATLLNNTGFTLMKGIGLWVKQHWSGGGVFRHSRYAPVAVQRGQKRKFGGRVCVIWLRPTLYISYAEGQVMIHLPNCTLATSKLNIYNYKVEGWLIPSPNLNAANSVTLGGSCFHYTTVTK